MKQTTSWRSDVSFADRLQFTMQIYEAYHNAFSQKGLSANRNEARKVEDAIFKSSDTKDVYERRCHDACTNVQRPIVPSDQSQSTDMPSATRLPPNPNLTGKPSRALGKYTQCVHHYSGLFSTIYLCPPEPDSKQLLAIKAVSPSSEAPPHNSKREARILAALSHANIVQLLDTQEVFSPRTLLLVFPFQPFTLEDLLTSQNIIPNNIIQDIFYGLSFIHGKGTIHRDVKPTNILLSSLSGPALLCDFGIAWSPTDPASEPREAKITDIGTTSYRAPELLFGCRFYSEAVDLWAAGCVMAEILVHNAHPRGKEGWTLFDAGELGSELALVRSIFETLGTPNERSWPESKDLPDWGKMTFLDFPAKVWEDILPGVDQDEAELVKDLVRYESKDRERAKQVLQYALFEDKISDKRPV